MKTFDSLIYGFFLKFTNNIIDYQQYWIFPTPSLFARGKHSSVKETLQLSKTLSREFVCIGLGMRGVGTFSRFVRFLYNLRLSILFSLFFCKGLNGLVSFLYHNFKHGYNVFFFDTFFNYNYIPVSNKRLLKRGKKNLKKLFKFFKVNCVVLLNMSNKRFIFKKLKKRGLIMLSSETRISRRFLDFSLVSSNHISDYLFYLLITIIYKRVKTDLRV